MSLTVNGVNNVSSVNAATGSSNVPENEDVLFEAAESNDVNKPADKNLEMLEAKLADLQAELKTLETEKAQKEAYKKELEAQRKSVNAQRNSIERQIQENEAQIRNNEEIIKENEQKIQAAQKEVEKLEKEYNKKNAEAAELNEQINEKIAQLIEDSDEDVKELSEKIRKATEEAQEKVQSGEIQESEVAQYVAQKTGNSSISTSNGEFAAINSLVLQVRNLINGANQISDLISAQQIVITGYQANITNAINANVELAQKNVPLKNQLNEMDSQYNEITKEINAVDKEIAVIDTNIAKVNNEIIKTENEINGVKGGNAANNTQTGSVSESAQDYVSGVQATTSVTQVNPFLAISYDSAQYLNMTDALQAMAESNENSISDAQAHVESNRQQVRKMFQDIIK